MNEIPWPEMKILTNNSIKEMQLIDNKEILEALEALLPLSGPWRRWREELGFVHMTGSRGIGYTWTKCGTPLNSGLVMPPWIDVEEGVTCLACLAQ